MLTNTLINKKWLKEFSLIPLNFDTKEVENFVKLSELEWIIPTIGQDWYDELLEQVKTNTLTPENSTALVEAIWPYEAMAVCYEALPSMLYHISETSITKGKNDFAEPLDLKEVTYYEGFIKRQLQVRGDYCKKWICEHSDSFPLADVCSCGCKSCNPEPKLNLPKRFKQLYTPCRKNTRLQ